MNRTRFLSALGAGFALVFALAGAASCSSDANGEAESCMDGEVRDCGQVVGTQGDVLTCATGTQTCSEGTWNTCSADGVSHLSVHKLSPGSQTTALSSPGDCVTNPCNPWCKQFDEKPDAAVIADGSTTFNWPTGSVGDLPGGLVNKGVKQPCSTGYDCQFNEYCNEPKTGGSCAHSKCQVGTGLSASCDPCVQAVCAAAPSCCTTPYVHSCSHDPCTPGGSLKSKCDPCVEKVCAEDPDCCKGNGSWDSSCVAKVQSVCGLSCPLGSAGAWTQACVDRVHSVCDAFCSTGTPIKESAQCIPWSPGQKDPKCAGVDLALGVTCETKIPVCNHGNTTAPAGVRIVHFPANSSHFPQCDPGTHAQMEECSTTEAIPPGECRSVDCPSLGNGNREVMVNPPGAGQIAECHCQDNWTLHKGGVSCSAPSCSAQVQTAQFKQVNLMFTIDRSGSMQGSKWTGTTGALQGFFKASSSAGMGAALEFYPLAAGATTGDGCAPNAYSCSAVPCSNPMVPLGVLTADAAPTDAQEQALVNAIANTSPGGGTPTYAAVQGALDWGRARKLSKPNDVYAVVLVTDGEPTQCNASNSAIAQLAKAAYDNDGIRTYTIGLQGSNIAALDQIASSGGTGQAFVVQGTSSSSVEQAMLQAFSSIGTQNVACSFDLPASGSFDPWSVAVTYTSSGGTTTKLTRQKGSADCGAGWYFDDPTSPKKIILCPTTCSAVQQDVGSAIQFTIGCPQTYQPSTVSQSYEAICPAATKPQWGYLSYDTNTPSDSKVTFRVRTASTQAGLATAVLKDVAVAHQSPDTQVCKLSGPSPCPIDLYGALGLPAAKNRFLELTAELSPSSDKKSSPAVNDWKITYSCPPAE